MQDLQPLSAYEKALGPMVVLSTIVVGLLWGIPMTLFMLHTHQGSLAFVATIGAIGGLVFGALVTMLARFATRQLNQQVYYGVWPLVPAAPAGEYDARLMCRLKHGRLSVGGHLYVGPESWVFVPHTKNGPFYRKPVRWDRPASLSFSTPRHDRLVLADGEHRSVLVVPNAGAVVAALSERTQSQPPRPPETH